MATAPGLLAEAPSLQDGSWILRRYHDYGPAGQIPLSMISKLLSGAVQYQSPTMTSAAGWLATEGAFHLAGNSPDRALENLNIARKSMVRSTDPGRGVAFPDAYPSEPYRRRIAVADLPLYGALALNNTISVTDIDANQSHIANIATDVVSEVRGAKSAWQISQMEGPITELIIRMSYNRAAMRGAEGILGFALNSTYRQDNTPFPKKKNRNIFLPKSNWDISLFIRNAEQESQLARTLGRLGRTAIQHSGLPMDGRWRTAAKLQVKSRRDALARDRQRGRHLEDVSVPRQGRWNPDQPVDISHDSHPTVASEYDQNQVTVLGVAEDIGLSTTSERLAILELLIAEAHGETISPEATERLAAITKQVKQGIISRVKLIAA
jgi:hypothetical protein